MKSNNATDEKELLEQLRAGDEQAFGILYNRYKGPLYVHAYKKLQSREEVKDIIHEIFLNIWEKRETLEIRESLDAYLFRAVRYKIINVFSRKKNADSYIHNFQDYLNSYTDNTDHLVREKMLCSVIDREIGNLPPKMRHVFELSRKEGLSHKEIAEQLSLSQQSVRSHVKNALHILKLKLGIYLFIALLFHK